MATDTVEKAKPSMFEMVKNDGEKALYRMGARRISKAGRDALVSLLRSQKMKKGHIAAITELLETEFGQAAMAMMLGIILEKTPALGNDARVKRICEEFRIEGMAIAGESLLDTILESLGPHVKDIIRTLPLEEAPTVKLRIDQSEKAPIKQIEVIDEEDTKPAKGKVIALPSAK